MDNKLPWFLPKGVTLTMCFSLDFLIPHLANVNVTDRAGRTSLHHAAFNGHVEVFSSTLHVVSKGQTKLERESRRIDKGSNSLRRHGS